MDWFKAYEIVIKEFQENNISNEILEYVKRFLAYHASNVAEIAIEQKDAVALLQCQQVMLAYAQEYRATNRAFRDRLIRFEKLLTFKCAD